MGSSVDSQVVGLKVIERRKARNEVVNGVRKPEDNIMKTIRSVKTTSLWIQSQAYYAIIILQLGRPCFYPPNSMQYSPYKEEISKLNRKSDYLISLRKPGKSDGRKQHAIDFVVDTQSIYRDGEMMKTKLASFAQMSTEQPMTTFNLLYHMLNKELYRKCREKLETDKTALQIDIWTI